MLIRASLAVDEVSLQELCRRNGIRRLALFGSVLRDDFGPESDVDILVEFEVGSTPGLIRLARMELELETLFGGRNVDLRTYGGLSRYFRDEVRKTAELVYDAAA